jgi:hypothetical protein
VDHLERGLRVKELARAAGGRGMAPPSQSERCSAFHHGAAIVGAEDDLAVAVLDEVDQGRADRAAVVRQDGIGIGELEDGGVPAPSAIDR